MAASRCIAAVEASLTEKNDKYYLKCRVRGKEVLAKPEEIIRQLWLHRLEYEFGYPFDRLAVEYPITFGRDSSKRADIVVFPVCPPRHAPRPGHTNIKYSSCHVTTSVQATYRFRLLCRSPNSGHSSRTLKSRGDVRTGAEMANRTNVAGFSAHLAA